MSDYISVIGDVMILLGLLVFVTAGIGFLKFPDVYMRVSALGTAGGIGIILVVAGALFHNLSWMNLFLALTIIVIQLGTSAVGSTAVARSALLTGVKMEHWQYDELEEDINSLRAQADKPAR
ncbi:monovalent cation/proton antiporter, MnhG/PhaG subunit [Corynebacterium efficiens YS-314]|uniref:Uncharacterized protein n=1 Tax=Corynebacterium efficiens (strain DSM 44549 / YS-314 / AJ 12310 / JCM 11189 / NBRC 100395) TaxID=196164 RepID=Q8FTZ1_COREF|nr:monovalent cation/H(+) antiporter subunit G [Corynebacterium efficiens]EEW48852.1 monovalent cation/proton antiporter, MnhG/PhaG subunit [Corynebacterium efficiens YS-314]BAC17041.1 conserved hypothetical protein [Corynebacterium efficiens YS-314]